jgi:hypothetical protein
MQHYITSTFSLTRSFLFNDPLFRFRFPLLLSPPSISIDELHKKIQKKKKNDQWRKYSTLSFHETNFKQKTQNQTKRQINNVNPSKT